MSNLVKITLHGKLGKEFGKEWTLAVSSVSEAINAINTLTNGRYYKFLSDKSNKSDLYKILINGEDFLTEEPLNSDDKVDKIKNTNLVIKINDLKTIDILPHIELGDSGIAATILGALLIIVGIAVIVISGGSLTTLGVGIIMVGAGLLAAGITALLSKPPTFDDFRDIGGNAKVSYLFNGPQNVTREGGPVPIGYGRLLVGSQVIGASYVIKDVGDEVIDLTKPGDKFYVWSWLYYLRPGDPTYPAHPEVNHIYTLRGGYYELDPTNTTIVTYRPLPEMVIDAIEHGFPYTFDFIGPDPDKNPFPDIIWNGKNYPFGP